MKTLIALFTVATLSACSSTPVVKPQSRVQTVEEARVTLEAHVEKANLNQNFCGGKGFDYYSETSISYSFRCKSYIDDRGNYVGGGYFHLVK